MGTRLATVLDDGLGWQGKALCAQTDPELFFPEKGGSTVAPKQVCQSCDVRAECLEYALEHGIGFGIWGGMSEQQRRKTIRLRATGGDRPHDPTPEKAAA
jgi:WhiB family redox-sensing transcriptional regulator